MTNENPSSHATILVAVIGLIGVLGAAAIANWDSLFPEELVGMQHTEAQKSETLGSTSKQDPEVEREPQIPQKPEGDAELATSHDSQTEAQHQDRKSVVEGKSESESVDQGGCRISTKKTQ